MIKTGIPCLVTTSFMYILANFPVRLYFTMRTCLPCFFESAQRSFDVALRSSLERISTDLQTKLLRHTSIVSHGPIFDDALSVFNTSIETDLLSNPSEIDAPKLMKKMADIYITRVTKNAKSTFSLSPRQMALWTSQREDHTSDWIRTVPISGLGQTMNACSRVFTRDIYGDHVVSCVGIIGIKHHHNVVRDTLFDKCYRSRISAGKEVDIGLDGGVKTITVKYEAKCANIGYSFLPFSFSSLEELEEDEVTLLKRIRKFSIAQYIRDVDADETLPIFLYRIGPVVSMLLLKEWGPDSISASL
ncbi:hypothetical protein Tco_1209398 [Tanacetum coccineum]